MLLFDHEFYPAQWAGREDVSSDFSRVMISVEKKAIDDSGNQNHAEQDEFTDERPLRSGSVKRVNNKQKPRSILKTAAKSHLLPGCWDYSEVD